MAEHNLPSHWPSVVPAGSLFGFCSRQPWLEASARDGAQALCTRAHPRLTRRDIGLRPANARTADEAIRARRA